MAQLVVSSLVKFFMNTQFIPVPFLGGFHPLELVSRLIRVRIGCSTTLMHLTPILEPFGSKNSRRLCLRLENISLAGSLRLLVRCLTGHRHTK